MNMKGNSGGKGEWLSVETAKKKKSFLGPGSNFAALGLIAGLQPGCQQESRVISSSVKRAVYCRTGEGGLSVKMRC